MTIKTNNTTAACSGSESVAAPIAWMNRDHVDAFRAGEPGGIAWASPTDNAFYTVPLYAHAQASAPRSASAGDDEQLAAWARNWHWNDCAEDKPVDPSIYFRDMRMLKAFLASNPLEGKGAK